MRSALVFIFFLWTLPAIGQERNDKVFSFKNVPLFSRFSEFPDSYKHDCISADPSSHMFCSIKTTIGAVEADVDFYFNEGHLTDIDVYFDPKNIEIMSQAMLKKLGPAAISYKGSLMWYATNKKPYMENFSDTVVFNTESNSLPMVAEGSTVSADSYAVISYNSFELVRIKTAKDIKDQKAKAESAAKDL